jgi:hypothetical protein
MSCFLINLLCRDTQFEKRWFRLHSVERLDNGLIYRELRGVWKEALLAPFQVGMLS